MDSADKMSEIDPQRLQKLISALADGTLDDVQTAELFEYLESSMDNREVYIDHMMLHSAMFRKMRGKEYLPPLLVDSQIENNEAESSCGSLPLLEDCSPNDGLPSSCGSSILGFLDGAVQKGFGALPGMVTLICLVSALSMIATLIIVSVVSRPNNDEVDLANVKLAAIEQSLQAAKRKARASCPLATVARISRVIDAKWSERSWRPLGLDHLSVGRCLELEYGLAEIKYNTGASVILRGPVIYNVTDENAGLLNAGQLTAKVPEAAKGFTIETPQGNIVDYGTEFGVEVNEVSVVDVHVFQGKVEVDLADSVNGVDKISLFENQAISIDTSTSQLNRFASQPEVFIREINNDGSDSMDSEKFYFDDFAKDTSYCYAGSNSYGGGGSFKIHPGQRGVLEITSGQINTYSVVSKQPLLGVGESFSAQVPGNNSKQSVFLVVSTVAAEPKGGMGGSFGLRFRRDERGLMVHCYGASRACRLLNDTFTADPDQSAPLLLTIDRISPTEFMFYYDTGNGPVPLSEYPITNEDLKKCERLHVGVEAWGLNGGVFQFDDFRIKPISIPKSIQCRGKQRTINVISEPTLEKIKSL